MARFKTVVACRGGGKTVAVLQYMLHLIATCPGIKILFGAQSYQNCRKTAMECVNAYVDYWEENNIASFRNSSEEETLYFDFGDSIRKIIFVSYANKDKNRGLHGDLVVLDECGYLPIRVYEYIADPMIAHKGFDSKFIFTGTPHGRNNVLAKLFNKGLDPSFPDYESYVFKGSDSGLLDTNFVEKKREDLSEEAFLEEYECDFNVSSGEEHVYSSIIFKMKDRINSDILYDSMRPVYVACDLGRTDYFVAWFFQVHGNSLYFIDYYQGKDAHISEHAANILGRGYPICSTFLPPDAVSRTLSTLSTTQEVMANFGLRPIVLPPSRVWPGILGVKQMLHSSYFNAEKCRQGLDNLVDYRLKIDEKIGQCVEIPIHESPFCDTADAMRYVYVSKPWIIKPKGITII